MTRPPFQTERIKTNRRGVDSVLVALRFLACTAGLTTVLVPAICPLLAAQGRDPASVGESSGELDVAAGRGCAAKRSGAVAPKSDTKGEPR